MPTGVCYGNWQAAQANHGNPLAGANPGAGAFTSLAQAYAQYGALAGQFPGGPVTPKGPLERAGITTGEIIGWRIWRVKHGYLLSFSADHVWVPGEPMTGEPGDHDLMGVWAFKKQKHALSKMIASGQEFAYGTVALWGEIVEHEIGYRAQYARVLSIVDWIPGAPNHYERVGWFRWQRKKSTLDELRSKYVVES